MADWCYYAVGFNGDSIIDLYEEELVQEKADGDRSEYEEAYGRAAPLLYVEQENLELFYPNASDEEEALESGCAGLSSCDGELAVTEEHPNFKEICSLIRNTIWPDVYFVAGVKCDWEQAMEYAKSNKLHSLHICEIEPQQ